MMNKKLVRQQKVQIKQNKPGPLRLVKAKNP